MFTKEYYQRENYNRALRDVFNQQTLLVDAKKSLASAKDYVIIVKNHLKQAENRLKSLTTPKKEKS